MVLTRTKVLHYFQLCVKSSRKISHNVPFGISIRHCRHWEAFLQNTSVQDRHPTEGCRSFCRGSFDGEPHAFAAVFRFDDSVFQFVEPFPAVEHAARFLVLTHQDAALGVLRRVARVDADARIKLFMGSHFLVTLLVTSYFELPVDAPIYPFYLSAFAVAREEHLDFAALSLPDAFFPQLLKGEDVRHVA